MPASSLWSPQSCQDHFPLPSGLQLQLINHQSLMNRIAKYLLIHIAYVERMCSSFALYKQNSESQLLVSTLDPVKLIDQKQCDILYKTTCTVSMNSVPFQEARFFFADFVEQTCQHTYTSVTGLTDQTHWTCISGLVCMLQLILQTPVEIGMN